MKVSLILGAGFSYNAGLPLVKGISDRFLQKPLYEQVLCFGSSEWKWKEWADGPDQHNGILPNERIPVAMVVENLIGHYFADTGEKSLNYEKFYQYMVDMRNKDGQRFEHIKLATQDIYDEKFEHRDYNFDGMTDDWIFSCFYHLIDDLLWVRKPFVEIQQLYKPYIDYFLNGNHTFNIYTLNHDLLLETIFEHCKIPYADGFSTSNKFLMDYNNEQRVPVFDGTFNERINLLKLHGSIDLYEYRYIEDKNRHKDYDYFKTMDYHTKHGAIDIAENGEIVQRWTPKITPQFITGDNKFKIIEDDKMYSVIYLHLKENLPSSDQLVVVGYSFQDEHINRVIQSSLKSINQIIHINPGILFPYEHPNVVEINPFEQELDF